ncbi:MAG: hypothetical protein NTU47_01995 [Ignavibacteriales bacterium]|nr:hypothetical protein [Ignavibacteriales bacterium]
MILHRSMECRLTGTAHETSNGLSNFLLSFVVLLAGIVFSGCSKTVELTSRWTNQELRINGTGEDWKDATTLLAGPQVFVGVKNDKENLYLCLSTSNRMTQMQMLALGTSVWFDTSGRKSKMFGIDFPVSGLMQGRRFPVQQNPEDLKRLIEAAQRQYDIVGPGEGERHRMTDKQDKGIDVHLGYTNGTLTYELKIPLQKSADHPYAVGANPLNPLTIGVETGEYSDAMRAQMSGAGRASGGSGGGGRGGRGGGGQSSSSLGGDAPEPLKHWLIVHLTFPN